MVQIKPPKGLYCFGCKQLVKEVFHKGNKQYCRFCLKKAGKVDSFHFINPHVNRTNSSTPQYWQEFTPDAYNYLTEQILDLLRAKGFFTSDDLEYKGNRTVIGAVINSLARRGIIKKDGHVKSRRKECHEREICRWVKV